MNRSEQRYMPSSNSVELPAREAFATESNTQRPDINRMSTFEGPTQLRQTSENHAGSRASSQIRPVTRISSDPYADSSEVGYYRRPSPEYQHRDRSVSPATSHGSAMSRTASGNTLNGVANKRAPPPPPPRSKKPPPPPPPMVKKPMVSAADA